MTQDLCPCHSGKDYAYCCKPYHEGKKNPKKPSLLMRSRYSAYALGLASYIIETTHKDHPDQKKNKLLWKKEILQFSRFFSFTHLKILEEKEDGSSATVTFIATLFQGLQDCSFQEKSNFRKENDKWFYLSGLVTS